MANSTRLTVGKIARLTCDGKAQDFLWDVDTPGLAVRVTASGKKTFIYQARVNSKSIRMSIGDVAIWSISDAQEEARRLAMRCDVGDDPRIKPVVEPEKIVFTLEMVWTEYVNEMKQDWGERHYQDHLAIAQRGGDLVNSNNQFKGRRRVDGPIAQLLDLPLTDLTKAKITEWLDAEKEVRPTRTALAFRLLRACINWTAEQDQYSAQINLACVLGREVRRSKPAAGVKKDCLQREQLGVWFAAVGTMPNIVFATYVQVLLLTGSRRTSMLRLKWSDVDFRWNSLSIWDKVDKDFRLIPLTPYVKSMLLALPRVNEYVFGSTQSKTGYISVPSDYFHALQERAGLPKLTMHGLRRSFDTLADWVDMPKGIADQIMGHKPSATAEKHYKVRPLDMLRHWHTKYEVWILEQAGINQPALTLECL